MVELEIGVEEVVEIVEGVEVDDEGRCGALVGVRVGREVMGRPTPKSLRSAS
jgi:hypothetical protein